MIKPLLSYLLLATFATLALCACTQQPTYRVDYPYLANARLYAANGLAFLQKGDTARAQEYLDTAMNYAPNDPFVIDALAFYDEKNGDIGTAQRLYFQAILLNPKSAVLRRNYAVFLCRNGYSRQSIAYLMKTLPSPYSRGAKNAYTNVDYCAEKLGDREEYAYYTKILWKPISKQVTQ